MWLVASVLGRQLYGFTQAHLFSCPPSLSNLFSRSETNFCSLASSWQYFKKVISLKVICTFSMIKMALGSPSSSYPHDSMVRPQVSCSVLYFKQALLDDSYNQVNKFYQSGNFQEESACTMWFAGIFEQCMPPYHCSFCLPMPTSTSTTSAANLQISYYLHASQGQHGPLICHSTVDAFQLWASSVLFRCLIPQTRKCQSP